MDKIKYKITSGKTPVIVSAIMFVLFFSLYLWLKINNNGAMLLVGIFLLIMATVFLLTLFRLFFYKLIIYEDGFFYQTTPFNGKYFSFSQVEKAWLSQGTETNGYNSQYLNFTVECDNIHIQYFYNDEKAVKYFIKQSEKFAVNKENYVIDGKFMGKTRIIISIVLLVIICALEFISINYFGFNIVNILGFLLALSIVVLTVINYFCFRVDIGSDGFYLKTSPFNGKFYNYDEISSCKTIKKKVSRKIHRRRHGGITYYFFFCFTDSDGKEHRFQFESPIHQHEIEILKQRITK